MVDTDILLLLHIFGMNLFIANLTDLAYRASDFRAFWSILSPILYKPLLMLFTASLGFMPAIPY